MDEGFLSDIFEMRQRLELSFNSIKGDQQR
jgi:hypothetical protein